MQKIHPKQKANPFLAFLKEQANAKGIPFDSLCDKIGYSPKVIEALEENAWFEPSDETLILLANTLGESLEELHKKLQKFWSETETRTSDRDLMEVVNLYELMSSGGQYDLIQALRRRAERFLCSQEFYDEQGEAFDEQAGLVAIEHLYANLSNSDKANLVRRIQRADAHYHFLVARDEERRLGFTIVKLDEVL
ncbi:MAG: helix-turn-helix transcriptional regulator [Anaerolineales bacterium]|nr:helix-turn-helix transcriptional regulator [Anaerolineales bacterium]